MGASFLSDVFNTITIIQVFTSLFFAVLFLQSGTDKIVDRMGNIEYIRGQFTGSPMEKFSTELLTLLTVLEILCGLTCLAGAVAILFYKVAVISFYGVLLATLNFLFLFTAQRIAKDYAGAVSIVSYFILAILSLFFLSVG
jgi:putative oxidoreductase